MITRKLALLCTIMALTGALLACSLSWGGDEDSTDGSGSVNSGTGHTAPVVQILEPASGTRVAAQQPLDITVQTDATTTSFILSVDDRVASSKALPSGQSGPTTAILSWTPTREGTFSVQVVAFNQDAASQPASLLIEVSGTAASVSPGTTASGCTGRVLISNLNARNGPGTSYTRVSQFNVGETMTVVGRSSDTGWFQIQRLDGQQVWVINNPQWLESSGQCANLPVTG